MRSFVILLALVACNKAPPDAAAERRSVHPDLICPADTIDAGQAPPSGYEVWCHLGRPDGSWVRQGPSISWHPNEQYASVGGYAAGRRTGDWEFFYANGQLEKQGAFVGGVENGLWRTFHPNGAARSEGTMVDGKEHGPWQYWEDNGSSTSGAWTLGEREGIWTEHDVEGNATAERTYKSGRMIGMREL